MTSGFMHWGIYLYSGFTGTVVLTAVVVLVRGLGLTRMDFPMMLGTMVSANRDRAKVVGLILHFVLGWAFSFFYILTFLIIGYQSWAFGVLIGLIHALFLLSVGMWILPSIHPRMASEEQGPDPTHQLEPPGFLALNYGSRTPLALLLSHMIYGGVIGLFYH